MADPAIDSDDLAELWGPGEQGALQDEERNAFAPTAHEPDPSASNGNGLNPSHEDMRNGVASLADASSSYQGEEFRRPVREDVNAENEAAFTQQLAAALYELLAASNDRFARVEDDLGCRLHDLSELFTRSVDVHASRLAASLEAHQDVSMGAVEAIRTDFHAFRREFSSAVDALASLQRDLRHEVARLGDIAAAQTELSRGSDADAERLVVAAGAEPPDRSTPSQPSIVLARDELRAVSTSVEAVREAVASLQDEVTRLRQAVARQPGGGRRFHRKK